jgi:hypothetical protein
MLSLTTYNQVIATGGDQALYPAGQPVRLKSKTWGPRVGQPVLWDPILNESFAPADIPTKKKFKISVGVGNGSPGSLADRLVTIGGAEFDLCKDEVDIDFTEPSCGAGPVWDIAFGCPQPNASYAFAVHYRDAYTKVLYGGEGEIEYYFKGSTGLNVGCDECLPTTDCFEMACKIEQDINEKSGKIYVPGIGNLDNTETLYMPISAAVIPAGTKVYHACLAPVDNGCDTCAALTGLESLTLDATTETELVIDLTPFNNMDDLTDLQTLKNLEDYLWEQGKDKRLRVWIDSGEGNCCCWKITIISCAATVDLVDINGAVVLEEEDPFTDIELKKNCLNCGEVAPTFTPQCLIRLHVDTLMLPCSCGLPGDEQNYINTRKTIERITFLGDDWVKDNFFAVEKTKGGRAEGTGYQYVNAALRHNYRGGDGSNWYYGGHRYGMHGTPMKYHQIIDAKNNVVCEQTYCANNIRFRRSGSGWTMNKWDHTNVAHARLLIPNGDSTTAAAMQSIYAQLDALSNCNMLGTPCGA